MQKEKQFEELYQAQSGRVYRFALRLCGNREDAEDLAAEAFAAAYTGWERHRGDSTAATWLYSIVLNRWRMHRRKRTVPLESPEAIETVAATFRFEDLDLAYALSRLPGPLREAFLLVKGEGLSHAEAAAVQRVPVGTVAYRVHMAIRRLRSELRPRPLNDPIKEGCDL